MATTPRISLNKLAEYIVSRGGRQTDILRDQKFPQDYKVTYYREASEAIATCISSDFQDTAVLRRATESLEQRTPDKVGTMRRITKNADAIEVFTSLIGKIDLKGGVPELGEHAPPRLTIHGVDVSVRPEIVLRGKARNGKSLVGAVKVHLPRNFPLTEESAGIVSAVLQRYTETYLTMDEGEPFWAYCSVVDVGSASFYPGVKATAARLKEVDAECRNINAIWNSISIDD